ncbi:MAG: response regulator [Eubacteriales bacterium]|nr:response regulator [Eubacteriales bacterium]
MTVLIVNDEVWTADMMKEEVDWEGCGIDQVKTAYDADGARKQLMEGQVDILLCDIEMPGENGIELLRWVREKEYDAECIFLTCHANFIYAQEAVKLNCLDYILMPARTEEIQEVLCKVVQGIQKKRDNRQLEQYGARWVESQKEEAYEVQGRKSNEDIIRDCEQYIHQNLKSNKLSVNQVADYCHLNPIYLNRIFRKEKSISIGQYIIRERMTLAAKLLSDASISAQTVAEKTGYMNYSYFSTAFKKFYGCSPQHYAERRDNRK